MNLKHWRGISGIYAVRGALVLVFNNDKDT